MGSVTIQERLESLDATGVIPLGRNPKKAILQKLFTQMCHFIRASTNNYRSVINTSYKKNRRNCDVLNRENW